MSPSVFAKQGNSESVQGITKISVSGYKSLDEECSIEVRPLTILAGANSSGKSSIMQPLLLMKQTLEATYDPGALLLNGPNVKFTWAKQLLSQFSGKSNTDRFTIQVEINGNYYFRNVFQEEPNQGIDIIETYLLGGNQEIRIYKDMTHEEFMSSIPEWLKDFSKLDIGRGCKWTSIRRRCFLEPNFEPLSTTFNFSSNFQTSIRKLLHVPGLRGNPERTYPITAIGSEFPGTFENYVASVVNHWQENEDTRLEELSKALKTLGLTSKIGARRVNDVQIELRVSRLPGSNDISDMVNIADVGIGVSQVLPVLVALLVAEPEQLVYLEQPEIHLHPRAQANLAEILADAAKRGVRVVLETHSDLLLRRIQSLVAEDKISPDKVKLHWFRRKEDGVTQVNSADLTDAGAFGDWPEDFGDVALQEESRYLDAAEKRSLQAVSSL
ncbi:MAG: AAA family ATPase [Coleofasciculaceae cyanobacterium]